MRRSRAGSPASWSSSRLTADVARELDTRLRESVADAGIPGASAAIVFRDALGTG